MITIKINDYTGWEFGKGWNDGRCVYYETAKYNGTFVEGKHENSSDYPTCEFCGNFSPNCDCVEYQPSRFMRDIANTLYKLLDYGTTITIDIPSEL